MIQNLCDTAKAVRRRKFIATQTYFRKQKYQINNLTLHWRSKSFSVKEKEKQTKSKVRRRKEIIKIRAEINERKTKKKIENINEMKSWFFEKKNKIDKPLTKLKKKKESPINKIRNEKEVKTDTREIQRS